MHKQLKLKDQLEKDNITEDQFLEEIMKLDQSDLHHVECFDNVTVLTNPEVQSRYLHSERTIKVRYLRDLRFSHFHCFQNIQLVKKSDFKESIAHLKFAVASGKQYHKLEPDEEDLFLTYMHATLSFMEKDLSGLTKYMNELDAIPKDHPMYCNTVIIRRLHDALVRHENATYFESYY